MAFDYELFTRSGVLVRKDDESLSIEDVIDSEFDADSDLLMAASFVEACSSSTRLQPAFWSMVDQISSLPEPLEVVSIPRGGVPVGLAAVDALKSEGYECNHVVLPWSRTFGLSEEFFVDAPFSGSRIVLDGWTGSGETIRQLRNLVDGPLTYFAVLSDPRGICEISGTRSDFLVPHSMLYSATCGGLGRMRLGEINSQKRMYAVHSRDSPAFSEEYVNLLVRGDRMPQANTAKSGSHKKSSPAPWTAIRHPQGVNESFRFALSNPVSVLCVPDGAQEDWAFDLFCAQFGATLARTSRDHAFVF